MLSSCRSPGADSLALPAPGRWGLWPNPRGFPSAPLPPGIFLPPLLVGMVILGAKRSHRRLFRGCSAAWGQWDAQTSSPRWEMKGRGCGDPLALAGIPQESLGEGSLPTAPSAFPAPAFPPSVPHWGSPAFMGTSFWGGGSEVRTLPFPWELEKPAHLQGDSVNKERGEGAGGALHLLRQLSAPARRQMSHTTGSNKTLITSTGEPLWPAGERDFCPESHFEHG